MFFRLVIEALEWLRQRQLGGAAYFLEPYWREPDARDLPSTTEGLWEPIRDRLNREAWDVHQWRAFFARMPEFRRVVTGVVRPGNPPTEWFVAIVFRAEAANYLILLPRRPRGAPTRDPLLLFRGIDDVERDEFHRFLTKLSVYVTYRFAVRG
jgi:hypothetical protein